MGLTFQLADTVYRDFTVYNGAPIRLRHIMRVDTVTGIEQIGISFTPMTK